MNNLNFGQVPQDVVRFAVGAACALGIIVCGFRFWWQIEQARRWRKANPLPVGLRIEGLQSASLVFDYLLIIMTVGSGVVLLIATFWYANG